MKNIKTKYFNNYCLKLYKNGDIIETTLFFDFSPRKSNNNKKAKYFHSYCLKFTPFYNFSTTKKQQNIHFNNFLSELF